MSYAVVALNPAGLKIAERLAEALNKPTLFLHQSIAEKVQDKEVKPFHHLADLVAELFPHYQGIVFIMAAGIVVRVIAPYVKDKHSDPAIVAVDEGGRFAISLLSGHEGGANQLALEVANALGAEPVVTTGSEAQRHLIIGIGSRKGITKEAVMAAIEQGLQAMGQDITAVRWAATIDLKGQEQGILAACNELGLSLRLISSQAIADFKGNYQASPLVKRRIGVEGVCEPCALLAGKKARLILPKRVWGGVTIAIAQESFLS